MEGSSPCHAKKKRRGGNKLVFLTNKFKLVLKSGVLPMVKGQGSPTGWGRRRQTPGGEGGPGLIHFNPPNRSDPQIVGFRHWLASQKPT